MMGIATMASPLPSLASSLDQILKNNALAVKAIVNGENLVAFRLIEAVTKRCAAVATSVLGVGEKTSRAPVESGWDLCSQIRVTAEPYFHQNIACILNVNEGWDNFCPSPFVLKATCKRNDGTVALEQFNVAVVVALYNMALACHIQYKVAQCMARQRILSSRARILYHKAAQLLNDSLDREQIEIYLAICLNACGEAQDQGDLGEIRFWLARFDQAVCTFKGRPSVAPYLLQRQVFYIGQFSAASAA